MEIGGIPMLSRNRKAVRKPDTSHAANSPEEGYLPMLRLLKKSLIYLILLLFFPMFAEEQAVSEEATSNQQEEPKTETETQAETKKKPAKDPANEITVRGKKNKSQDGASAKASISANEIENKISTTTGDAIKEMAGVYVDGSGNTGQSQYVFLRGFRSADVLVLVDGVPMRNPVSPNGAADLAQSPEDIAKIELLKGPQPVLFGSGAIAGVIDIHTKKGAGKPKFVSSISTGILDMSSDRLVPDTFNVNASVRGSKERFFYSGGGSFFYTEGISEADSYHGVKENLFTKTPDNDGVIKGKIYFRGGVDISDATTWDLILRTDIGKYEIDDGPGLGLDDPNRILRSRTLTAKTGIDSDLFDKLWNLKFNASVYLNALYDDDPADAGKVTGDMNSLYKALTLNLDWDNSLKPLEWYEILAGIKFELAAGIADYEDYSSGRKYDLSFKPNPDFALGLYLMNIFKPVKKLEINAGFRLQTNFYQVSLLDSLTDELLPSKTKKLAEPLFSAGIAYETPIELGFKARFARASKAPTLFQRFSRYSDLYNELLYEIAYGFDGVIQQYLVKRKILLEAGYFYELKINNIDLDKSGKYSNHYRIENHGLEFSLQTKPFWGLSFKSAYTFIFKLNEYKVVEYQGRKYKSKTTPLRRPKHTFSAELNYNYKKILNIFLGLDYVGVRNDEVYNYPKTPYIVEVDQFVLLNFAISWKVHKFVTIFAKIDNMLDNDSYAYSVEYGTPGITPWIGLKLEN